MVDHQGLLPASLQPWNRASAEPKSFGTALGRIYAERGHFRHITEDKLRTEIANNAVSDAPSPSDSDMDEADAKETAVKTSRSDQLAQARREAIEHVASAQNEALLALDFVSLLLSKDVKQAESTISPILKQGVPPGTLGLDMWSGMTADAKQEETDRQLARGKRMESLAQSANALMAASDRLKTTVDRERRYWNEILKVRESGWSVCRMPRERGTLGVRYDFAEARGEFARRGLAALKMGKSGEVVLDRGLGITAKALRVRVVKDGVVQAESSVQLDHNNEDEHADVEARIRTARDSLFEEELFHEAMREARTLASYGVNMKGNTISMPLSYVDAQHGSGADSATNIEVDLVSEQAQPPTLSSSPTANGIATALRLLLSHVHHGRLERRSEIPAPMSSSTTDKPVAEIIRPLLSGLQHHSATTQISTSLSSMTDMLSKAGITTTTTATHALAADLTSASTAASLFAALCQQHTLDIKLAISVPSAGSSTQPLELNIKVTTWLSPPLHRGTTFHFSCPALPSFSRSTASVAVLQDHVMAAVQAVLTEAVGTSLEGWEVDALSGRVERPVLASTGGVDAVAVRFGPKGLGLAAGSEEVQWTSEGLETRTLAEAVAALAEQLI